MKHNPHKVGYARGLSSQIAPVHVNDLTRAKAALELARADLTALDSSPLGPVTPEERRMFADMLGVEDLYVAGESA